MSKIVITDVATDPLNPAAGTHAIYTKPGPPGTGGVFVKDNLGNIVGPFGVGGGSGITQLTADVTAGPGSGSQVATIAPLAVTTGKIDNKAVDISKLADPVGGEFSFLWADSATSWKSDLPARVKFESPSRISILGDTPVFAYNPQNPRVVNSVGADIDLGYLARTQWILLSPGGADPPSNLPDGYTFYEINFPGGGGIKTYFLPDFRAYPPGSEIILLHHTGGAALLTIQADGGPDANRAIVGPAPVADQIIFSNYNGRRLITNGSSGWVLIGAF